jgi:hypothetical protein
MRLLGFWRFGTLPLLFVVSEGMHVFRPTDHIALPGSLHVLLGILLHLTLLGEDDGLL